VSEEQLCDRGITFQWEDDGSLSFWKQLPGVTRHPQTGQLLYFNQINSQGQHRVSIGDERADLMEAVYGNSVPRPYSVAFSDGDLTEAEFMAIHEELEHRKVSFGWQAGDVMLLENKLTAHGRHSFSGHREVQVILFE
jgi:hypothetical protein